MSTAPHSAHADASTQRSGWSHIISSIKDGFICAGIWAILGAVFGSAVRLWGDYSHPEGGITSVQVWGELAGGIIGQFVLMSVCLSSVAVYRRWKNVTPFVFLDWRWWLGLVLLSVLLKNPPLAWVWVGLIYQVRLTKHEIKDEAKNSVVDCSRCISG
jgi:hypothetical protein